MTSGVPQRSNAKAKKFRIYPQILSKRDVRER